MHPIQGYPRSPMTDIKKKANINGGVVSIEFFLLSIP